MTPLPLSLQAFRILKACLLFLAFAPLATSVLAAGKDVGTHRLFDEANILYQQDKFEQALEKYRQIEDQGFISVALLYNMGNCYYKLNQTGRSVLYYERALRLNPKDQDTLANLAIANLAGKDKIVPPPEFALARWLRWALYLLPFSILLKSLAAMYMMMAGLIVLLTLTRRAKLRSLCRKALVAIVLPFSLSLLLLAAQWQDSKNRVEAIVLAEELPAMDAPDQEAKEIFSIHEGTKVRVDQTLNGWSEIVLLDGKLGWVSSDGIEII